MILKINGLILLKNVLNHLFFQQYQLETETHQAVMSKSIIILLQMIMILNICIRLILEINNY